MILKIKYPTGVSKLTVNDDIICADFCNEIMKITGLLTDEIEISVGFPPVQLDLSLDNTFTQKIIDLGIKSGCLVTVSKYQFLNSPNNYKIFNELKTMGFQSKVIKKAFEVTGANTDLDSIIDICESIQLGNLEIINSGSISQSFTPILSKIVRKSIAANNSCLFNSIDYILSQNPTEYYDNIDGEKLRGVVSSVITQELHLQEVSGSVFTPKFLPLLEMPPLQYVNWILQSSNWGGEVENLILAYHFNCIINVYDIRTCLKHSYGSEEDSSTPKKHIFLLYDGVHYDPLIGSDSSSNEIRYFTSKNDIEKFNHLALEFVKELNKSKKFVNLNTGEFLCNNCFKSFQNQKDAMKHAQETGHINFGHK